MGKRKKLKKSDGGQLEINRQDLAASDEAILPNVDASDEAILRPYIVGGYESSAEPHVVALNAGGAQENVVASNATTDDQSVVASDQEIGEHNCALSQLKQKDSIGIDCFRIRGH